MKKNRARLKHGQLVQFSERWAHRWAQLYQGILQRFPDRVGMVVDGPINKILEDGYITADYYKVLIGEKKYTIAASHLTILPPTN